ncbi:MAG: tetratricopeptide repeat protein [Gammaproteobacteria bacterium]|nr:tetratricopeptide repeat protein [Gammaproteobacteria bacterium]MBU0787693.1 tetratricopeptide repeat protein [Gammaproteobacteria bacterium]MBU0814837.1 tetratricopeptide repeat protein [Gammaproteobacteria bacterium]MBU1786055.1 tetratricopeptide repeat protein [Gammaproteobacteria bacterium]
MKGSGLDYYDLMLRFKRPASLLVLLVALCANAQTVDETPAPPPSSALDGELFYQLLLGELNTLDGEPGTGYALFLDAARKTGDGQLYQRAVEIALQARSGDSALQAARAWRQHLPNSREANRYVLQILLGLNRISETVEPLKREIALSTPDEKPSAIAAIPRYYARVSDKKLAASIVERALADYLNTAVTGVPAWTAIGYLRSNAGDRAVAVEAARRGQALDPQAEAPVILALSLISPGQPAAEAIVRKYLEGKARAEIRMEYARILLDTRRYAESAAQIHLLTTENPDFAQAWLIQGTLEFQEHKPQTAEKTLLHYIQLVQSQATAALREEHNRGLTQAYLLLAQIAEQRKDFAAADAWLNRIDNREELLRIQTRRAAILARRGQLNEARALIHSLPERNAQEARLKLSAEVQLLRDNKEYQTAYALLAAAIAKDDKDFDLQYDLAMVADKLGRPEEMERVLRQIITANPQYHHAYNALGYSLAERNLRLPEARELILKALEFAPGDPFITDSLGWVEYRSGNKEEALRILQGAYKAKPDTEIAAHLGEVLWSLGQHEQARIIWREGMLLNAENETLLETLKRLRVKL